MSDVSGGPGWWRASDGRWYPPEQHPDAAYREGFAAGAAQPSSVAPLPAPASSPSPSSSAAPSAPSGGSGRWVLIVGLMVLVAVVVAGVVVVVSREDGGSGVASASVTLESSVDPGADPFTSSVAISEVSVFPSSVQAVSADVRGQLETEAATGTLVAVGSTTPGLYGGSEQEVCKPDELVAFLEGDQGKASAWAGVFGIDPSTIGEFVGGLTPLVLTSDTWVTNHGFAGGVATPRQSVLQAGTAVMVDATGVPRVKCSCGNPLLEPTREQLSSVEVVGDPWEGYDPSTVTVVDAGTPTDTFTVVDIETGDTFQQEVSTGGSVGIEGLVLAPDGLGIVTFEQPRTEVVATLTSALGEPDEAIDPGAGVSCSQIACHPRSYRWGRLVVYFDQLDDRFVRYNLRDDTVEYGEGRGGPVYEPGPWEADLKTPGGVGLGSTEEQVRASSPQLWEFSCTGAFEVLPVGFSSEGTDYPTGAHIQPSEIGQSFAFFGTVIAIDATSRANPALCAAGE